MIQEKHDPYCQANPVLLKSRRRFWQRQQCQQQILRSQVDFGPWIVNAQQATWSRGGEHLVAIDGVNAHTNATINKRKTH